MSNTNNMNKTRNTYNTQGSKNESNVVLHGNHSEHHNRELKYVKTCYWTNLTSCSLLFKKKTTERRTNSKQNTLIYFQRTQWMLCIYLRVPTEVTL
jgi:hypothetical protein